MTEDRWPDAPTMRDSPDPLPSHPISQYSVESDKLQEADWYDAREKEDRELQGEREFRQAFVESIYQRYADGKATFRSCEKQCRRRGRCCYLREATPTDDDPQPLGYNLRVRFMPLCLARKATARNAKIIDWLRYCADEYLR